MKLIVGLGNPGREYVGTRHNVGFEVMDALASKLGWTFGSDEFDRAARNKFDALAMDGNYTHPSGETEKVLLLKPMTYMNVSGKSVQQASSFYQVSSADIMVVLDDLALPCGTIRMRASGSDGGHNGLRDIQRALGTQKYGRLRLGIDAPPPFVPGKDYVLQRFTDEQRKRLEPAIQKSATAIVTWIDRGIEVAMSQFNAEEKKENEEKKR